MGDDRHRGLNAGPAEADPARLYLVMWAMPLRLPTPLGTGTSVPA
jgi:hypothetical protein